MTSMLYSPRHSIFYMNDIQDLLKTQSENSLITLTTYPPSTTITMGSQYSNMRVTQQLHRYRSMKKQWQEVATFIQSNSSVSSTCTSSVLSSNVLPITQKSIIESKDYYSNDCINTTIAMKDINEENSIDLDPLYSRIQQDLIKLRKIIKTNQNKFLIHNSLVPSSNIRSLTKTTSIPSIFNDQENNSIKDIKKASSLNNIKPLDRVKISGCQMRSTKLPKSDSTDSGIGSNSSSTCSQYSKQQKPKRQNNSKTFNISNSRINPSPPPAPPPPLPIPVLSECSLHRGSHLSKKKPNISSKTTQNLRSKQNLPSRLSLLVPQIPTVVKKKSSSFNVQDTRSPPLNRQLSQCGDITTRLYTYAASTSSATPCSMMLKRNTSLLPILIQSSSCIGIQPRETKLDYNLEEEHKENITHIKNNDDDYYHLLDYKHLINRLPKPVIYNRLLSGKDDYGILRDQLSHIRKKMPPSNIYDEYARNS